MIRKSMGLFHVRVGNFEPEISGVNFWPLLVSLFFGGVHTLELVTDPCNMYFFQVTRIDPPNGRRHVFALEKVT